MPELPEVETIRGQLEAELVGEIISEVEVRRDKSWRGEIGQVAGLRICEIKRVGKYLFFHTNQRVGIVGHLKMTGRMIVKNGAEYEAAKHTRVVIRFGSGKKLYFWDTRVFGYLEVVFDSKEKERLIRQRLGAEPWMMKDDEFYRLCQRYQRPIKSLILDQELVAGVGNIYANDGLWLAQIDPRRAAKTLTKKEAKRLLSALCQVMERGLVLGGASDNSYVNAYGERGSYQDEFLVYRREDKPCKKCTEKLKRVVIGGRGSFVCEKCQK